MSIELTVSDTLGCQVVESRVHESLELRLGHARSIHRLQQEEARRKQENSTCTRVDNAGERSQELSNSGIEDIIGDSLVGEGEIGGRRHQIGVGSDGHGQDGSVCSTTTARKGPVEVRVLRGRGDELLAGAGDDLPLKDLIGGKAILGGKGAVATALAVASGKANRAAVASDQCEAIGVGKGLSFGVLDAGADLDGLAFVSVCVVVEELGGLDVVRPESQGTGSSRLAVVVVARVSNHQADVLLLGKLDRGLVVGSSRSLDGVLDEGANDTAGVGRREEITTAVGEEGSNRVGGGLDVSVGEVPDGL